MLIETFIEVVRSYYPGTVFEYEGSDWLWAYDSWNAIEKHNVFACLNLNTLEASVFTKRAHVWDKDTTDAAELRKMLPYANFGDEK